MSGTHPMQDRRARPPYLAGRGVESLSAVLAGVGFWMIGASPVILGWLAVAAAVPLFIVGRRQARRAWEHLPSAFRGTPEPAWLTLLAGGVSIAAVATGVLLGASYGPLPAVLAVAVGGLGMYFGYRELRGGPRGATLVIDTAVLVAGVGVATFGMQGIVF